VDILQGGNYICPHCGTDMKAIVEEKKSEWVEHKQGLWEVSPFSCDTCKVVLTIAEDTVSGKLTLETDEYEMGMRDETIERLLRVTCNKCKHRDYCIGSSYDCPAFKLLNNFLTYLELV